MAIKDVKATSIEFARRLAPRYVGGHKIKKAGSLPRLSICNPNVGLVVGWLCFVDVSVGRWVRCLV